MRKMKLISGCAAIALAVTGLGSCSNSQSKNRAQAASLDDNFASVYIYEDNAVVFSRDYELWSDDGRGYIYMVTKNSFMETTYFTLDTKIKMN